MENDNNNIEFEEITNENINFDEDYSFEAIDALDEIISEVEVDDEDLLIEESPEDFEFQLDCLDDSEQENMLWQAKTGLNDDTLCGAIETIVFMSDRPINLQRIKSLIDPDIPLRVIHQAISRLQDGYERTHHGIRLQEVAEGYQFRTKATYSKYIQDIFKINSLTLSPSALEVMAIIAYKQPISKSEIERIRGVDSSHIVRALMDKRLVKIVGRSEELGRPLLCGTTLEFLEVFNLKSLNDLPKEYELEEMATASEVGAISEIKEICLGNKTLFNFDDIHELDEIRETIKSISAETPFTKSLDLEAKLRNSTTDVITKSAFELLEEYIHKDRIEDANKHAGESDVLTSIMEPRIVDLEQDNGLLNAPVVDDDDFDYVLTQKELEAQELEAQESEEVNDLFPEAQPLDADEAKLLSEALDEAFSRLGFDGEENELTSDENMEEKMDALDDTTEKIMDLALDLDLDLSFMKEEVTSSDVSSEELQ